MRSALVYAVPRGYPSEDWNIFLRDSAGLNLPSGADRITEHVWLVPDEAPESEDFAARLSRIAQRHAISLLSLRVDREAEWTNGFSVSGHKKSNTSGSAPRQRRRSNQSAR